MPTSDLQEPSRLIVDFFKRLHGVFSNLKFTRLVSTASTKLMHLGKGDSEKNLA